MVAVVSTFAATGAAAPAEGDASAQPESPPDPDGWAIFAGIGLGDSLGVPSSGLRTGIETRLTDHLWLMLGARGALSTHEVASIEYRSWFVGGFLGPRVVFNPGDRLRASAFVVVGGGYGGTKSESPEFVTDDDF